MSTVNVYEYEQGQAMDGVYAKIDKVSNEWHHAYVCEGVGGFGADVGMTRHAHGFGKTPADAVQALFGNLTDARLFDLLAVAVEAFEGAYEKG